MVKKLTEEQIALIAILQRLCSTLSVVGCVFIMVTSCFCNAFKKPRNRLAFYASFGNLIASLSYIVADSFVAEPTGARCQMQAILIQTFTFGDVYWTLAMAINVYLTIYYRFDAKRLRKLDAPYLILCYGIPLTHALCYLIPKNTAGEGVYGSCALWCWVAPNWVSMRSVSYAIIWSIILITLTIYLRCGGTIYRIRQELWNIPTVCLGPSAVRGYTGNYTKTSEVTVASDVVGLSGAMQMQGISHQVHVTVEAACRPTQDDQDITRPIQGQQQHPIIHESVAAPRPSRRTSNIAIWQYTKCALLFFAAIFITWIPSSANRTYSVVHPGEISVALQFLSSTTIPLQGFWNAIIYCFMSKAACKALMEVKRPLWLRQSAKTRGINGQQLGTRTRQPCGTEGMSAYGSRFETVVSSSRNAHSESTTELANSSSELEPGQIVRVESSQK